MDKLTQLNKMMEMLKEQTISPKQLADVIATLVKTVNEAKADLNDVSRETLKETKDTLQKAITYLEEGQIQHKNALETTLTEKSDTLLKKTEDTLKKAQEALKEISKIEVKDGEPGINPDPKDVVPLVLKEIKFPDPETGEQIVDKINDLEIEPEKQIDAKHIKNLPKAGIQYLSGASGIKEIIAGTNVTVDNTNLGYPVINATGGGGGTWGSITGTLSSQTDLQTALNGKVDENTAITGATKTKITYDTKGLVTAGADATTADIADSANKRYVTDANLTVIGNTSGTNTGDNATNTQYSGLVTNATHTGDATGATVLTLATVNSNVGSFTNANITVNAKGLVTAASNGSGGSSFTWTATTVNANMAVANGYLANKGTLLTMTLPATAAVGDIVEIAGMNAGLWKIAQNASGIIHFGSSNTTTGTGGYLASTLTYDAVKLVCVVANNEWLVTSSIGNITVV